jgi:hypothetical protein
MLPTAARRYSALYFRYAASPVVGKPLPDITLANENGCSRPTMATTKIIGGVTMFVRYARAAARELLQPFQGPLSPAVAVRKSPAESAEDADSGTMVVILAFVLVAWMLVT